MQHSESSIKIYWTKDYSMFGYKNGNRDLNLSKINKIKNDIMGGVDMLKYCPIVVKQGAKKMEIIDGQHRFEVAKSIKSPVWYVIINSELDLVDIAKMNSRFDKWKPKDFLNCYVQKGVDDYKVIAEFHYQYKFSLGLCLQMLKYGSVIKEGGESEKSTEQFQNGSFKVLKKDEAYTLADIVTKFNSFSLYKSRPFMMAICKIMEAGKVSINDIIEKYQGNKEMLTAQDGWKGYISNLENIYNHRLRSRILIY